jgi:hypothetical protein
LTFREFASKIAARNQPQTSPQQLIRSPKFEARAIFSEGFGTDRRGQASRLPSYVSSRRELRMRSTLPGKAGQSLRPMNHIPWVQCWRKYDGISF